MKRQASGAGEAAVPLSKRVAMTPEGILKHQNRELGSAVQRAKEEVAEVRRKLKQLEAERDLFDATTSVVDRSWKLLDSDLLSLAHAIGIDVGDVLVPRVESDTNGILPSTSRMISTLAEGADGYVLADVTKPHDDDDDDDDDVNNGGLHLDLEATMKKRIAWTTSLMGKLITAVTKGETIENSGKLHAQIHALEARILFLSTKIKLRKTRIRELSHDLENAKMEIWRLSRRLESFEAGDAIVGSSRQRQDDQQSQMTGNDDDRPSPTPTPGLPSESHPQVNTNGSIMHEGDDKKSALEEIREIAASRLEELEKLKQQLKEALTTAPLKLSDGTTSTNSDSALQRELQKERQSNQELSRLVSRANATSILALRKLREAEDRIEDLESASDALAQAAESTLAKENARLKQALEESRITLDRKTAEIEAIHSISASAEESRNMLKAVSEERDALKRKLDEHQETAQVADEADGLITEIEQLSAALGSTRESVNRLQQVLAERDKRVAELLSEKNAMDADLRELREEKNALALRSEKVQAVLKENEAYVARVEERLTNEHTACQRAEDMARASAEACEKAQSEREQFKREAEAERERASAVNALEEELRQTRVKMEEVKWELSRSEEEVKTLKRRLERAKAALESAAKASSSSGGREGLKSIDEERLEAMTSALRCPVYQHLWRDCVITKCAHMFSRKALEDNLAQRNRKCPSCKNTYSKDDILNVYLYQSNDL